MKPTKKLKVIIITQRLSRVVNPIIQNSNVVGIIESKPREIQNHGTFLNLIVKLSHLLFSNKRNNLLKMCKSRNLPYFLYDDKAQQQAKDWILNKSPELIVVYSMSQLLPKEIFEIPRYGTVNLHPSLLPKYPGRNPWFWQYFFMDKKGGVTVHYIDKSVDKGDVIYQEEYEIPIGIKSTDLYDIAIGEIGVRLLLKTINNIENIPRKPQESNKNFVARGLKKEEHKSIINFEEFEGIRVWHILRGTEQWLKAIKPPSGIYTGQIWNIGNYIETPARYDRYKKGSIIREGFFHYLVVNGGKIELKINFSIIALIKHLLYGQN